MTAYDTKEILTPSLDQFASDIHYATINGWKMIENQPAETMGWQYHIIMQRPVDYSTEAKEKMSRQDVLARARVTLNANRKAARDAGIPFKEYTAALKQKELASDEEEC